MATYQLMQQHGCIIMGGRSDKFENVFRIHVHFCKSDFLHVFVCGGGVVSVGRMAIINVIKLSSMDVIHDKMVV